jgi:hypothetical protein
MIHRPAIDRRLQESNGVQHGASRSTIRTLAADCALACEDQGNRQQKESVAGKFQVKTMFLQRNLPKGNQL